MKHSIIALIFLVSFFNGHSQETTLFKYYVHLDNYLSAPKFVELDGELKYDGEDNELKVFFDLYNVKTFKQTFPSSPRVRDLNVFYLETTSPDLSKEMTSKFSSRFTLIEDLTNVINNLASYPNDYGPTSPNTNVGVFDRSELDYMGAPIAWDITTGKGTTIVISDAKLNKEDPDFLEKTTFFNESIFQHNNPYDPTDLTSHHGTGTAIKAVGQGDNGYGTTGVCYDCDLIMTAAPTSSSTSLTYAVYENLVQLAKMGFRVFNMSWVKYFYNSPVDVGFVAEQNIINTLVEEYDAILIASAGNRNSYQTETDFIAKINGGNGQWAPEYTGVQFGYPASYNGVISVSNIMHSYEINEHHAIVWSSPTVNYGQSYVEDSFAPNVDVGNPGFPIGLIYNGYPREVELDNLGEGTQVISPNGLVVTTGSNNKVVILASSDLGMVYSKYSHLGEIEYITYGGTTSGAAPYVSGTAGLMITINPCLSAYEVENILKLTAKDVEHMSINQNYFGNIGAGKLEMGKAVMFADEINKLDGNAEITNHIFYRWDFKLNNILNNLSISNVQFIENATVNFKARNSINIIEGTLLEPNSSSYVSLEIDPSITECSDFKTAKFVRPKDKHNPKTNHHPLFDFKVQPNPSNGVFEVQISKELETFSYQLFDFSGNLLLENSDSNKSLFTINNKNLKEGIYLIKVNSGKESITKKVLIL